MQRYRKKNVFANFMFTKIYDMGEKKILILNIYFNEYMKYCVVIPVYNSENHIADVIEDVVQYVDNIIVVDDGSTDGTLSIIEKINNICLITYSRNRGKGYALRRGFALAISLGFTHVVTLDADGQHKAKDINLLINRAIGKEDALIIGSRCFDNPNMPQGNRFANKFSNFWFKIQTGITLPDTQTGFRLYPVYIMKKMRFFTNRYESELEILVRCAWRNIELIPQFINVYYPPFDERISHFRKGKDFFRISIMNTVLCFMALLYGYPSMFFRKLWAKIKN